MAALPAQSRFAVQRDAPWLTLIVDRSSGSSKRFRLTPIRGQGPEMTEAQGPSMNGEQGPEKVQDQGPETSPGEDAFFDRLRSVVSVNAASGQSDVIS